jgi:hypothetical protein
VVPSSTGSMVVVVEILEGHVMVRFEDLFFGAPPRSMGFHPSSHNLHVFTGWVLVVP